MKKIFFILLMINVLDLMSQDFTPSDTLVFTGVNHAQMKWVDLNNDGRFDLFVSGLEIEGDTARSRSGIYWQQDDQSFSQQTILLDLANLHHIHPIDMNRDGYQDLLVSTKDTLGAKHFIFTNNQDSTFTKKILFTQEEVPFGQWQTIDLDNDGQVELALHGEAGNKIYEFKSGQWKEMVLPFADIDLLSAFVFYDQDRNGYLDILMTGPESSGDSISILFKNLGNMVFERVDQESLNPLAINDYTLNDVNDDGLTDIIVSAQTNSNQQGMRIIVNSEEGQLVDSIIDLNTIFQQAQVQSIDLNSDGIWDSDFEGYSFLSDTLQRERVISDDDQGFQSTNDTLSNSIGLGRLYADIDFDGDLDYAEAAVIKDSLAIVLYENKASLNEGPSKIESFIAMRMGDRIYMAWKEAQDDHTATRSISYDVVIGSRDSASLLRSASLYIETKKRSLPILGNNTFNTYLILKDSARKATSVDIMAVDNAWHYNPGNCFETSLGTEDCTDTEVTNLYFCEPTAVDLSTPNGEEAHWFSSTTGFIEFGSSINVLVSEQQFFVALFERPEKCSQGIAFHVFIDSAPDQIPDQIVCEGSSVELELSNDYASYSWSLISTGEVLSNSNILSYVPNSDDRVSLEVMTFNDCIYTQVFDLKIDDFQVDLSDSLVSIMEGESIELKASGGVSYTWTPEESINNSNISNPTVNPDVTTTYRVVAINELGCVSEAEVRVEVIQTAFLPDSFSPNRDGRNEFYKIYDLGQTREFTFSIFDRIGNVIYETNSYEQVVNRGWDGTKNGAPMAAGSYFWRIRGSYMDGQEIKINGGQKGAFHLIR